jgi:FHA domain-containing protein/type VI secretion system protein
MPPPAGGIPADYDPLADALAQWETPVQAGSASSAARPPHTAHETAWPAPAAAAPAPQGGPTGLPAGLLDTSAAGPVATPFDDLFAAPSAPPSVSSVPSAPVVPVVVPVVAPQTASARLVTPGAASAQSDAASPALQQGPATPPAPAPSSTADIASPQTFATKAADSQRAVPSPAPATPATPAQRDSPAPAGEKAATFLALLEGLGLDASRSPNLPEPEFARLIGEMLRESLRGTMAVLRARSMTKREARLDTTMIVARDNNPLKFFPDVDSALAQMLSGRSAGYLPPDEALKRAFDDIEAHELAVLAGMRAALAHVLGRFDPASIEAQLKDPGALGKVLSNRKAKLWDLFVELQGTVAREADDDFQKLFGKAFNDAYEAQIEALRAARERQPKDPAEST